MRSPLVALILLALPVGVRAQSPPAETAPLMGPGVSRELASYRAARVGSVRYHLAMNVGRGDTAQGTVTVSFARRGEGDAILDFRGPRLGAIRVNGRVTSRAE
jgi:aminopeptidase N